MGTPRDLEFQTDEQLAERLLQVERSLESLEVALPALRREVGRVRQIAFPGLSPETGPHARAA